MEQQNKKVIEYYDRNQIFYDLFWMNKKDLGMHYGFWKKNTKKLHEAILNENEEIAKKLDIKKSDIISDTGCGVGGTSIWLAENYEVKVMGINISEKQVELAKKYAKDRKVDHLVNFYVKDFCNTNFPDESFTKIFSIESVCHTEKKEDFISEAFRLLKRGGKLVVADFFVKEDLNKKEQDLINKWCYGWEMPDLETVNSFREKLETAGFKNIEIIDKTQEVLPSSRRMYLVIGKFLRFIFKILELFRMHKSYGGTAAVMAQYESLKSGAWSYGIFSAEK